MHEIARAEGIARLMIAGRDTDRESSCICCPGAHVFGAGVDGIEGGSTGLIHAAIWRNRKWIEGRRVRVTIEVLD